MKKISFYVTLGASYSFLVSMSLLAMDVPLLDKESQGTSTFMSAKTTTQADIVDAYEIAIIHKKDKSMREYVECCEKAAKKSNAWALNELGVINEFGVEDEKGIVALRNMDKAIEYYEKAALKLPIAVQNLQRVQEAKAELERIFALLEQEDQ